MRKYLAVALMFTMVMGLAGCKGKTDNIVGAADTVTEVTEENSNASVTKTTSAKNSDAAASETEENSSIDGDNCGEGDYELEFDVESEEDCITMLTGTWEYYGRGNGPKDDIARLRLTFSEDGTYEGLQVVTGSDTKFTVKGKWSIDRLFREDYALPDCLTLTVSDSSNPQYEKIDSFGDYVFDNFGILNGHYVMGIRVVNTRGVSPFESSDPCPVMYKTGAETVNAPAFNPTINGDFNGAVWRVDYEDEETAVWITDYSRSIYSKIGIVTKYIFNDCGESDFPIEAFDDGYHAAAFITDDEGKITSITPRFEALDEGVEEFGRQPSSNKISNYMLKRYDYSVTAPNGAKILTYFEKPIFGGTDEGVYRLNNNIDKVFQSYKLSASELNMQEELENLPEWITAEEELRYRPCEVYSIYYNDDVASVGFFSDWYMGGVYNVWYDCVNVDLNTGKRLTIDRVMDMSMDSVNECIARALDEEFDIEYDHSLEMVKAMNSIPFWFDDKKVYAGFGSYELNLGSGFFIVDMEY